MSLENKIEIKGICGSCKKETTFKYIGDMKYKRNDRAERKLSLYNCEHCRSTMSLKRIYNYENTKIM